MKQLTCEMCGSTDIAKQDGFFVCQTCGIKYSVEEAKKMMVEGTVEIKGTVKIDRSHETKALLRRAYSLLDEREWDEAEEYFQQVLDLNPQCADAYLGLLLTERGVSTKEALKNCKKPFDDSEAYEGAIRYGDENLKSFLKTTLAEVKKEYDRKEKEKADWERDYGLFKVSEDKTTLLGINDPTVTTIHIPHFISKIEMEEGYAFEGVSEFACITVDERNKHFHCKGNCLIETKNGCLVRGCSNSTIPSDGSIKSIGNLAFFECTSIKSIIIPNSVKTIGEGAFFGCTSLTEIKIPNSVKTIGEGVFGGCTSLSEVTLLGNIEIGEECFKNAHALKKISIAEGTTKIKEDFLGYYAFGKTISHYPVKMISIPNSVSEIEEHAFFLRFDCVEHVKIPQQLFKTKDANRALSRLENLKTVEFEDGKIIEVKIEYNSVSRKVGCYVATCVYGSYDCPQVWTLRRYRDNTLGATWYGRLFIRTYYAISPTLVKWFGNTTWFKKMWKGKLDRMVAKLQNNGVKDTPYQDKEW